MKKRFNRIVLFIGLLWGLVSGMLALAVSMSAVAWAEEKPAAGQALSPSAEPTAAPGGAERMNTESIKEKYWARGEESEIGVVQNRLYEKEHRWEFSLLGGIDNTDPMLSVYTLGGRLGYHFSEYFSLHLIGWKAFSSPSGTQSNLLQNKSPDQVGTVLNTNSPLWFAAPEAQWSLLYGKLSVVGKAIIHYDFHFMLGLGAMGTESGTDFAQHFGVGQEFFLSKNSFLNIDYRLVHYHETIVQKVIPTQLGQPVGTRENFSSVFTLGIGFMFGGGAKQ